MNKENQERSKILLKAAFEILTKCNDSAFVLNVLEQTAIWDGVKCDGYCLFEEIEILLLELKEDENA